MTRNGKSLVRDYFSNLELFEDSLILPRGKPARKHEPRVLSGAIEPFPASLEVFERSINQCDHCVLGKTRTKFVFGVGNPKARVVFVGEAPGREEDEQGIPFVGRAGHLLDEMLAKISLDRTHVYICNVLKCRPPGNRDPEPAEVEACRPNLLTQLSLINPEILVCLGRHAAYSLLGIELPMKDLRGRVLPWNDMQVLVTYHPAYYLRNMNQLHFGDEDFQLLRRLYDGNSE